MLSVDSSEVPCQVLLLNVFVDQVMASMVLQRSVVESLLGFTANVAELCGDLLDGQSVDLEVAPIKLMALSDENWF